MCIPQERRKTKVAASSPKQAADKLLSVKEIAATIFEVDNPTEQQLNQVRVMMAKRVLRPSEIDPWRASATEVARYLGSRDCIRKPKDVANEDQRALSNAFQQLAVDYFLAVTLRKKTASSGKLFDRMVLGAQIAAVLLLVVLMLQGANSLSKKLHPYQAAVTQQLSASHDRFEISEIQEMPASDQANSPVIRVRYRYFSSKGKPIDTERYFTTSQGKITGEQSSD